MALGGLPVNLPFSAAHGRDRRFKSAAERLFAGLALTSSVVIAAAGGCGHAPEDSLSGNWRVSYADSPSAQPVLTGTLNLFRVGDKNQNYDLKLSSQEQDFVFHGKWSLTQGSVRLQIESYWPAGPDKKQILILHQPYFEPAQVREVFDSHIDLVRGPSGTMESKKLRLGHFEGHLEIAREPQDP